MHDAELVKGLNYITNWYFIDIPSPLGGRKYREFVASSYEFSRQVTPTANVQFASDKPAACTDGKTIWLPAFYMSNKFMELSHIPEPMRVTASVAIINGSQIHEAYHVLWSTCKLDDAAKTHPGLTQLVNDGYRNLVFTCINIVEDLWIEFAGDIIFPRLSNIVSAKNSVLFNRENVLAGAQDYAAGPPSWSKFAGDLCILKSHQWRGALPDHMKPWNYLAEVALVVTRRFKNPYSVREYERLSCAYDLAISIMADDDLVPEPPQQPNPSAGGDQLIDANGQASGVDEQLAQALSAIPGMEKLAAAMNKSITLLIDRAELKQKIEAASHLDLSRIPSAKFQDVLDTSFSNSSVIEPEREWLLLGTELRQARNFNHTPGRARNHGSVILAQNLQRIVTDGNVLSLPDGERMRRGVPETILLGDCSGSMGHGNGSLKYDMAKAMLGGYLSMVEARLPIACYGHTTFSALVDGPWIYGVAAYEMPLMNDQLVITGNVKRRFGALHDTPGSTNLDGIALDFVANRFTSRPGTKLILVMCDGKPNGDCYRGDNGVDHTRMIVAKLRRKGITVLVASLVEHVVETNDSIYGKEFNIKAYGHNLGNAIRTIIQYAMLATPK